MTTTNFKHSKNRIFLLEITINLLLFTVLLIVGLLFFIKTNSLTEQTGVLHQAVNACNNVASVYEQERGNLSAVSSTFSGSICASDMLFIYMDNISHPCEKDDALFKIIVSELPDSSSGVQKADIRFLKADNTEVYGITACIYNSLSPEGRKAVNAQ